MAVGAALHAYRRDILSLAGDTVFLGGTERDPATGAVQTAGGALEESDIAAERGQYPIPVGAKGGAAREIWELVPADLRRYLPHGRVQPELQALGDESKTDEELVVAVFALIRQTQNR